MTARSVFWSSAAILLAAGLAPSPASAQVCDRVEAVDPVVLRAQAFELQVAPGTTLPMWGFALDFDGDPATEECPPTAPGPRIEIPPGQTGLTVRLLNRLAEPVSLVIPGQPLTPDPTFVDPDGTVITGARPKRNVVARVRSFVAEAPPAGEQVYTFAGLTPGTFLYQSGTDPAVQVQMGLYGPALVRPAVGEVLPGVAYDAEVVLVLAEVDPVFHAAVAAGDYGPGGAVESAMGYAPRWFLVNGAPHDPAALPLPAGAAGQRLLLRLLNPGLLPHVPAVDGWRLELVAREGRRPNDAGPAHAVPLPAGTTADVLVTPAAGTWRLYDRRLFLASGGGGAGGQAVGLEVAP